MLECYRVLDLTDGKGFLCGRALADFGADVIKIEPPGGEPDRNIGPYYHDEADPEKSLYWFAFNANKKSITLDIETADGRDLFLKLVKTADVVIESFPPGYLDEIGLGYGEMSEVNPGIILTSISGFGQKGPYRDYNDRDLAVWALSGYMYITGDPERPPLAPSYPHAHLIGAMNGAVGTMVALCHRRITGKGQQVDASSHQGLVFAISVETKLPWALQKVNATREGRDRVRVMSRDGLMKFPLLWDCQDGAVAFNFWLGPGFAGQNRELEGWVIESGTDPGMLKEFDWEHDSFANYPRDEVLKVRKTLEDFFMCYTKMELHDGAMQRRIQMTPVLSTRDLPDFSQHVARNFWRDIEHPELGDTIKYPGGFVKVGIGDCGINTRAPFIGEHNNAILKDELSLSAEDMINLKQRRII
ncbi:MAG: CoA transferase [Dehalococcoidales bacterium]|nr:CoA transferase [Dehalococcoidales bacterium]